MIGWLSCASGISGDMLLGALVDVGVPLAVVQQAVDAVAPAPVLLRAERVDRAGLAATRVHVDGTGSGTHRHWTEVRALLEAADFPGRAQATAAFEALAEAEAAVHGTTPERVHFHEVGALDAIADVVGVCAGFAHLGLDGLVVSSVAVGGGTVRAAHGTLPVPAPAVVLLLAGRPTHGGPVDVELATPTGAALAAALATGWGWQPPMTVRRQGFGAGGRDLPGHPNVLRLVLGDDPGPVPTAGPASPDPAAPGPASPGTADHGAQETAERSAPASSDRVVLATADRSSSGAADRGAQETTDRVVLESNVDDLDPRIWPGVLDALLDAGADDAWLVPILMKKGRPAHTLRVLARAGLAAALRAVVFARTPALGVREWPVTKHALAREVVPVSVDGRRVAVKLGRGAHGEVLNVQPEWEDVARAAADLGQPEKIVVQRALARFWARQRNTP